MIRVGGPASPYDPTYHLLTRFDKIAAVVARERPDVLEIHSPYLAALGVMRVSPMHYGVRTFQWHSDFIDTYAGVLKSKVGAAGAVDAAVRPLWGLVRAIAKRCDATLVASRWQEEKLVAHGAVRVTRVPFGVERSVFHPQARSYEGRRDLLALAGHDAASPAAVFVGLGRFAVEKRWDVVIDAFAKIRSKRDAVLVLFGDGPERARMKERAASRGVGNDVVLPGFGKDRAALARSLAGADALLHGCPFETFGLSIAEAMSCGLPVVVPDAGGAAETASPAVASGGAALYDAGNADACASAALSLLASLDDNPARARAAAAEAVARLPNVVEQFEGQVALYTELLERRRARVART